MTIYTCFSVFENIESEMQDANVCDRHARARHYNLNSGLGDVQVHIENLRDADLNQGDCSVNPVIAV